MCFNHLRSIRKVVELEQLQANKARIVIPLTELFKFFETSGHFYDLNNRAQVLNQRKTASGCRTAMILGSIDYLTKLTAMGITPILINVSNQRFLEKNKSKMTQRDSAISLPTAPTIDMVQTHLQNRVVFNEQDLITGMQILNMMGFPIFSAMGSEDALHRQLANLDPSHYLWSLNTIHWGQGVERQILYFGPLGPKLELLQLQDLTQDLKVTAEEIKVLTAVFRFIPPATKEGIANCQLIRKIFVQHSHSPIDVIAAIRKGIQGVDWMQVEERVKLTANPAKVIGKGGTKLQNPRQFLAEVTNLIPDLTEPDLKFIEERAQEFWGFRSQPNHPFSASYVTLSNQLRISKPMDSLPEDIPPVQ